MARRQESIGGILVKAHWGVGAALAVIAAELITQVKKSVTIDWTLRENARQMSTDRSDYIRDNQ